MSAEKSEECLKKHALKASNSNKDAKKKLARWIIEYAKIRVFEKKRFKPPPEPKIFFVKSKTIFLAALILL